MKKDIHPTYHHEAKVICACGNSFTVGSTLSEIQVEICSACHPFYTGKQKILDTAQRVDKFQKRTKTAKEIAGQRKGKKIKKTRQKTLQAAKKAKLDKDDKK